MTYEHIPDRGADRPAGTGRVERPDKASVNFRPFIVLLDGREILRSHSRKGSYCADHGRISSKLALQLDTMTKRIARKPNFFGYSYRDEMEAAGLVRSIEKCLKFDDSCSDNAFAYLTTIIINEYKRFLSNETKQQMIRDSLLIAMGAKPSYSYEDKVKYGRR